MNCQLKEPMNLLLKKISYSLIPRFRRTRLYWKSETYKFFMSNKLLAPRGDGEFMLAQRFNRYFDNLSLEEQSEVKQKLKKDLDPQSIETVNNFISRQAYLGSHNILEQGRLFTKSEIEQQKECSKTIQKLSKRISRYHFSFLPSESFYGLNGLKWLPVQITEKLKDGIFIDAGAYEGDTSLILAMTLAPRHIYAFEPEIKNFQILKNNCNLTGNDIIIPVPAGLADKTGKAYMTSGGQSVHILAKISRIKN